MTKLDSLPDNLPQPIDDGAADHLINKKLQSVQLSSTNNGKIDLSKLAGTTVIYCYPMTGIPGVQLPEGWDDIPGTRGCTPQSCSYRDHYQELQKLGAEVYGLSTQTTEYQKEMAERLHLPFDILCDEKLEFTKTHNLPTFEVNGMVLLKRLTIIVKNALIEKVHYPVFPSDQDPVWVEKNLKE